MIRFQYKRFFHAMLLAILMIGVLPSAHAVQERLPASRAAGSGQSSTPAEQVPEKKNEEEEQNEAYRHSAGVTAFGKMLGLNANQAATAFTLVNLFILIALVGWFLVRTLPKTFKERSSSIQKNLVDARTATEEANARLSTVEERLSRLDGQIAEMKAQAEKESAADEQRMKASVEDEKAKILAAAEQEIAAATTHAQRQIQRYAAELAIEQASRKLAISAETDRLLVQNFARRLGGDESKEGQN